MFTFLHLFCPYKINAAARHNTMHAVSSAALLLFTANCTFRDVLLSLHLPAPHLCFGSLYMEDVIAHRCSLQFHCMLAGYFSFAFFFQSRFSEMALPSLCAWLSYILLISWKYFYSGCYHSMVGILQKGQLFWQAFLPGACSGCTLLTTGSFVHIRNM